MPPNHAESLRVDMQYMSFPNVVVIKCLGTIQHIREMFLGSSKYIMYHIWWGIKETNSYFKHHLLELYFRSTQQGIYCRSWGIRPTGRRKAALSESECYFHVPPTISRSREPCILDTHYLHSSGCTPTESQRGFAALSSWLTLHRTGTDHLNLKNLKTLAHWAFHVSFD